MFEHFMPFGEVWLDPSRIVGVGFEWEEGFGAAESGLIVAGAKEKLKLAIVFLDTGTNITMDGDNATAFYEWWATVTIPPGEVM